MDNYEKAVEIYSQYPCDLKDAVRLLDGGLSSEEAIKVLKKKERKQEKRHRNELLEQIGDGMLKEMAAGWVARRNERRRFRESCISRWGDDYRHDFARSAYVFCVWRLYIPVFLLAMSVPALEALPYQILVIAFLIVADILIWAFRIISFGVDDESIHRMRMPMWAFRRWTRWVGQRLFLRDEENWNRAILTEMVGEQKAKKMMDKKWKRAKKNLIAECESLRKKELMLQVTRRYCSDWRETKELYEEITSPRNGIWLAVLFLVSWIGSSVVAGVFLGRLGMWYLAGVSTFLCLSVGVAAVFVALRLVDAVSDYEYEIKRTLKKKAIQQVMNF